MREELNTVTVSIEVILMIFQIKANILKPAGYLEFIVLDCRVTVEEPKAVVHRERHPHKIQHPLSDREVHIRKLSQELEKVIEL